MIERCACAIGEDIISRQTAIKHRTVGWCCYRQWQEAEMEPLKTFSRIQETALTAWKF